MTKKILRWVIGLPLLVGGLGGFLLALFLAPAAAIFLLIAVLLGVKLLNPNVRAFPSDYVEVRGPVDYDDINPNYVGSTAWHAQNIFRE